MLTEEEWQRVDRLSPSYAREKMIEAIGRGERDEAIKLLTLYVSKTIDEAGFYAIQIINMGG